MVMFADLAGTKVYNYFDGEIIHTTLVYLYNLPYYDI